MLLKTPNPAPVSVTSQQALDSGAFEHIACELVGQGYTILDHPLPATLLEGLFERILALDLADFKRAGIGRQQDFQLDPDTRRDRIHWLDSEDQGLADYFQWIEALRLALNSRLFLGLFDYECHFAWYPPGGFYKKHLDAFQGQSNRRLSTILYLNPTWQPGDGGELAIYHLGEDRPFATVRPEFGRMVIFLSEEFPHEVLPAKTARYSLTGWYRVNGGSSEQPDPPLLQAP